MPAPAGIVVFGEKQADSSACGGFEARTSSSWPKHSGRRVRQLQGNLRRQCFPRCAQSPVFPNNESGPLQDRDVFVHALVIAIEFARQRLDAIRISMKGPTGALVSNA